MDDELRSDLIAVERDGWRSLCDGSASAFYERTMTEDGLMVLANGSIMSRADVVSALADAPQWASFELRDERAVRLGDDAGMLVYVGTASRSADAAPFEAAMSSVYVRRDGSWRLALYQQTSIAAAGPG